MIFIISLLLRNYNIEFNEDNNSTITLYDNSIIYFFENTFFDSFINDLTVINIYFPDYQGNNNYFREISLENDLIFKITKKCENIILKYNKGKFNYYLPYEIKLRNKIKIERFKFILYYGLLNHINCFINYNGEEKYSCEYFYYYYCNSLFNLPEFKISIGNNENIINNYDTFNSRIRKIYVLINIPNNNYTNFYEAKYNEYQLIQMNKSKNNK